MGSEIEHCSLLCTAKWTLHIWQNTVHYTLLHTTHYCTLHITVHYTSVIIHTTLHITPHYTSGTIHITLPITPYLSHCLLNYSLQHTKLHHTKLYTCDTTHYTRQYTTLQPTTPYTCHTPHHPTPPRCSWPVHCVVTWPHLSPLTTSGLSWLYCTWAKTLILLHMRSSQNSLIIA